MPHNKEEFTSEIIALADWRITKNPTIPHGDSTIPNTREIVLRGWAIDALMYSLYKDEYKGCELLELLGDLHRGGFKGTDHMDNHECIDTIYDEYTGIADEDNPAQNVEWFIKIIENPDEPVADWE